MGNKLGKNNRYVVSGRKGSGSQSQGNIRDVDSVISPPNMARRGSEGTASPALSDHDDDEIMSYSGPSQAVCVWCEE